MAMVFLARDERLRRQVALKVLAPTLASDESFRLRFIQESRAAAAVDDPHIIPVYEAGEAAGVLYIAMRYVAGGDVQGLLERERQLPAAQVAAIVSAVASALDSAHAAGLVHRDVKPANILLDTRPGRPDHVYLSDFGLSKGALAAANLTRSGMFIGTPDYTAPEQIHGHPVTGQADQYGLACTAFELLCGEPVFVRELGMAIIYAHVSERPPSLQARRPDLPAAAGAVLARALAKAPQDRFGSCQEFAEALRRSLNLGRSLNLATVPPVPEPGEPAPALATPTAGYPLPSGPGPGSQTESLPVPGRGDPPVPVAVPVPPGRSISRRALLVTGAAAVPVAASAGLVLWAGLRQSGRSARWQARVPDGQAAMLAADGDLVVAAGGPAAYALDARTGRRKWSARSADGTVAGVAVTSSVVYLALDPAAASPFLALSASSGTQLWTEPFTSRHGLVTTPGYVYAGTSDLFALSSDNGSPLWDIVAQLKSNMVTQAGVLYMLAAGSGLPTTLRAVNSADGTRRWTARGPDSGVLATDGRVVCAAGGRTPVTRASCGPGGPATAASCGEAGQALTARPRRGTGRCTRSARTGSSPRSARPAGPDCGATRPTPGSPRWSAARWSTPVTRPAACSRCGPATARCCGRPAARSAPARSWPAARSTSATPQLSGLSPPDTRRPQRGRTREREAAERDHCAGRGRSAHC
jgi:serine/threonine-protein kinase